jgi:hypothetical protein
MSKLPAARTSRDVLDLIALVAVLTTAILLIILGHITAGSLMTICGALVTLYGAWSHFRPGRDGRRPPRPDVVPDEEGDDSA